MTKPDEPVLAELSVTVDAPIEQVWRALRDPAEIARWHGWDDPGLAEEIEIIYLRSATADEANHELLVDGGDRFVLTDLDGRTLVRLTRAPIGANPDWDAYYDDINEGWTTFLNVLRFALERHPGVDRRTVYLGADGPGAVGRLAEVSELFDGVAPGDSYDLVAPTGERLTGQGWYRSDNQVGVTVDGWGDGLLVAARTVPSPAHPDGGGMLILSTYGLGSADVDRVRLAWSEWWGPAETTAEPETQ